MIDRYSQPYSLYSIYDSEELKLSIDHDGEYVKYEDHLAIVKKLQDIIDRYAFMLDKMCKD